MSVVALKNAVTSLVPKSAATSNAPLLTNSPDASEASESHRVIYGSLSDQEAGKPGCNERPTQNQDSGFFGKVDPRIMSDLVIGLSDGLTVPFALTAGLSSLGDSKLVITGGLAELISGAISMGLGGYLGAKSESDYYYSEVKKEKSKFYDDGQLISHEVEDVLLDINPDFSEETIVSFIRDLQKNPELMVDFIIRYGKGLEEPAENRQLQSALTIGGGYFAGGFVPLLPYFFVHKVGTGLGLSVILMTITLFWFGYIKAQISMSDNCTLGKKISEGIQMVAVGGVAAGAAWFFVKLLG